MINKIENNLKYFNHSKLIFKIGGMIENDWLNLIDSKTQTFFQNFQLILFIIYDFDYENMDRLYPY